VAGTKRLESVFLNIPYDRAFEDLYLAYIVGLTQLGLRIHAALAVPNLSRVEVSRGVPRFNMPVELGLALYRSHATKGNHRVFIFESKARRALVQSQQLVTRRT